jgi:hypothetical protein
LLFFSSSQKKLLLRVELLPDTVAPIVTAPSKTFGRSRQAHADKSGGVCHCAIILRQYVGGARAAACFHRTRTTIQEFLDHSHSHIRLGTDLLSFGASCLFLLGEEHCQRGLNVTERTSGAPKCRRMQTAVESQRKRFADEYLDAAVIF